MELVHRIPVLATKAIMGRLRGRLSQPFVIFVHGLGSNMDHHLFFNGARFFEKKGFASFRFNFYGESKGFRKMKQGTLKTQVADLEAVVKYFRNRKVNKIFVVGHSYGGLTVLLSRITVEGLSVWEPSFDPYENVFVGMQYIPQVKGYVYKKSFDVIIGKPMVEEAKKLDCVVLGKNTSVPTQIVTAGRGNLMLGNELYFQNLPNKKEFVLLKGAGHNFHEEGAEEKLFSKTYSWFKKIM